MPYFKTNVWRGGKAFQTPLGAPDYTSAHNPHYKTRGLARGG